MRLEGQSSQPRRLQGNLGHSLGELSSCQNYFLTANEQVEMYICTAVSTFVLSEGHVEPSEPRLELPSQGLHNLFDSDYAF